MASQWYIDAGGRVEGPFTATELNERAADGRLVPTAGVSHDRARWVPASSVPELKFPPRARPLQDTVVSGSVNTSSAPPEREPTVLPDVSVTGYRILGVLGTGACGVVYRAQQEKLNRTVALKTVLMPDKASGDLIERFKQEAVSLARLQHPNVVAVYDSGLCETPKGQVFFAMELLDGEDLDRRVERTGPLDERTAWLIARQTAAALAHAAKLGVVHRDVKPANLFLVPPPTGFPLPPDVPMVKVTDFGLALTRGGPDDTDTRQTAAGVLLGTPIYMAPEQFSGSDVDLRADIYSLGATVYHALAGHPPYGGRTVYEVMKRKSEPAPRLLPPVTAETADLVAAMMAEHAADRPADYDALLARIDALPCLDGGFSFVGSPTASGRTPAAPAPRPDVPAAGSARPLARKRWVYAVAAVAVLGLALGVAVVTGALKLKRPTYVVESAEGLYDEKSVRGWNGQSVTVEEDADRSKVLAISSTATRGLKSRPHFRVKMSLDLHRAAAVEFQIATTADPAEARWVVRLDRASGAAFGKRVRSGPFEPVGPTVPVPTPEEAEAEGGGPYSGLDYQRAGGTLTVWFRGQSLGSVPDSGLVTTELRVQATGGAVRINGAGYEELVEVK